MQFTYRYHQDTNGNSHVTILLIQYHVTISIHISPLTNSYQFTLHHMHVTKFTTDQSHISPYHYVQPGITSFTIAFCPGLYSIHNSHQHFFNQFTSHQYQFNINSHVTNSNSLSTNSNSLSTNSNSHFHQ